MHDGVVMWDARGTTLVVNTAASQLWGDEPSRVDFDGMGTEDNETRLRVVERSGRWIAVSVFAVGDGGMAILRDVTAERELDHKRRDMQRLVSHELKTPLASIAGFGETLQRYELNPEEQQRVAALIRGEALRLGEMVATFLDLERLSTGQLVESTEAVDLSELTRRRVEVLIASAEARRQSIATDLGPGAVIRGSAVLIERVIDNLIGNAVKYSNEGNTIEIRVGRDDSTAVLTVTDHGPGIPEKSIPRLFERFYRVPGVGGAGSGLGLAFVAEVVDWHGGCIEVSSVVGKGSTFTVRLPTEG
jgi:signal transduction histidine kinase